MSTRQCINRIFPPFMSLLHSHKHNDVGVRHHRSAFNMNHFIILLLSVAFSMATAVHRNSTVATTGMPQKARTLDSLMIRGDAALYEERPKIIGGEEASSDEFPWYGYTIITVKRPFKFNRVNGCGSSFIHPDIVISAAHCVINFIRDYPDSDINVKVYLGYDGSDGTYDSVYEVSDIYWPQSYSFPENDIVFYKILGSISVPPVSWNTDPFIPLVGDNGTALGHGFTTNGGPNADILRKVNISVISNEECGNVGSSIVCTYTPGQSTCYGDSGGPIITQTGVLFGLTSFGSQFCVEGPGGFTRVSSFSGMIASVSLFLRLSDFDRNVKS